MNADGLDPLRDAIGSARRAAGTCWRCGRAHDQATWQIGPEGPQAPQAGDVSVCFHCVAVNVYTGNGLELRQPTPDDLAEIMADPEVVDYCMALERFIREGRS